MISINDKYKQILNLMIVNGKNKQLMRKKMYIANPKQMSICMNLENQVNSMAAENV